ncbi:MAG: hypothetical protein EBR02_02295 [Alphaproteobacteria bacterium]|nr:hypothetical protein [Alphaproteobacteria bacterium]
MKSQRIILAVLVTFGLVVAYCVYGPNGTINSSYAPNTSKVDYKEPSTEEAIKAKESVKLALKDPESAQFRNLKLDIFGDVCGEVNARNSFGGYTGFKVFQIIKGRAIIEKELVGSKEEIAQINLNNALLSTTCYH